MKGDRPHSIHYHFVGQGAWVEYNLPSRICRAIFLSLIHFNTFLLNLCIRGTVNREFRALDKLISNPRTAIQHTFNYKFVSMDNLVKTNFLNQRTILVVISELPFSRVFLLTQIRKCSVVSTQFSKFENTSDSIYNQNLICSGLVLSIECNLCDVQSLFIYCTLLDYFCNRRQELRGC